MHGSHRKERRNWKRRSGSTAERREGQESRVWPSQWAPQTDAHQGDTGHLPTDVLHANITHMSSVGMFCGVMRPKTDLKILDKRPAPSSTWIKKHTTRPKQQKSLGRRRTPEFEPSKDRATGNTPDVCPWTLKRTVSAPRRFEPSPPDAFHVEKKCVHRLAWGVAQATLSMFSSCWILQSSQHSVLPRDSARLKKLLPHSFVLGFKTPVRHMKTASAFRSSFHWFQRTNKQSSKNVLWKVWTSQDWNSAHG